MILYYVKFKVMGLHLQSHQSEHGHRLTKDKISNYNMYNKAFRYCKPSK